jgi:DNA-binding response OmpR family regulator
LLQNNSDTAAAGQDVESEHLLVVDDDAALRDLLCRYLSGHGYMVSAVADGIGMEQALTEQQIDLVILDLMLPGEDGLTLAKRLRHRSNLPIIILSAHGDEVDRIVGLEVGADDYLAKPFNPRELLARIRAVLRRSNTASIAETANSTYSFGAFRLDPASRSVTLNGEALPLTSSEFTLLEIFVTHPNRVLSRDTLLQLLKGYEHQPYDRSIDVRVTRLRRKLETDPAHPVHIRTVWGEGYLFSPEPGGE